MTEEKDQPTPQEETTAAAGNNDSGADDLRKQLDDALKAAETSRDQFLRKAAEFENFKRRTEAEYLSIIRSAAEGVLASLLPVVEDIARSLKSPPAGSNESFVKGVELIYQKLMKALEQHGLKPFESLGKPFDVHYHDALLQMPREDVPPGTVIEEVERGYMLYDKVLRHAKVVVSSPAEGVASAMDGEGKETPEA